MNLLHVNKEAVEITDRLAHRTHVLLFRVQGTATDGRIELAQNPPPLIRAHVQLCLVAPPDGRNVPAAHVLEKCLAVGEMEGTEATLVAAPDGVAGPPRQRNKALLHGGLAVHQTVLGFDERKLRPDRYRGWFSPRC